MFLAIEKEWIILRKKKALVNISCSLLLEIVTVLSGLIVPRLIIGTFGSDANGLVSSISSFVGYIALLQSGVGSVVKASLYKPLAQKDHDNLCVIVKTSEVFFRKIAAVTVFYLLFLTVMFPRYISPQYDPLYTASLVIIVGISTAAQYFFGITYQMLLEADQKSYVYSIVQIASVLLNTIAVLWLINKDCSIQIVKLASTSIYVLRPILINWYVKRKYRINTNIASNNALISQRWDGFMQAIAYFIHSKTDVFVLTVFATLADVSVYGVYAMVTAGLSSVITAIDKAVRSAFGNIIASDEQETLVNSFTAYNCCMHVFSTACFATAAITVLSFIRIYVKDVTDANYIRPLFALLIITAEYFYCMRMPYNSIIYAAGKFKETKYPAMVEAIINIFASCIMVRKFGLEGVAIGTLVAMIYRTFSFARYLSRNILQLHLNSQIRRYFVSLLAYGVSIVSLTRIEAKISGYFVWGIYAGAVFIATSMITLTINIALDYRNTVNAMRLFMGKKR